MEAQVSQVTLNEFFCIPIFSSGVLHLDCPKTRSLYKGMDAKKWQSHNFIFFPEYGSNIDTHEKTYTLIIDTPCITKILIECQLTYHVLDMYEVRMLKMSMLTCYHAVFLLEEINHATVLGMQGLPQRCYFYFCRANIGPQKHSQASQSVVSLILLQTNRICLTSSEMALRLLTFGKQVVHNSGQCCPLVTAFLCLSRVSVS